MHGFNIGSRCNGKGSVLFALKEHSDKNRNATKEPTIMDRRNLRSKRGYIEPDEDDDSILDAAQTNEKGGTDGTLVPKSLHDVASTRTSR